MAKVFTSDPAAGDAPAIAAVPLLPPATQLARGAADAVERDAHLREPVAGDALALLTALSSERLGPTR